MMKKRYLAVFLLFLVFVCRAAAAEDNLLANPGFEEVSDDSPDYWIRDMWDWGDGVSTLFADTVKPYAGDRCALVESAGANDARFIQTVNVEPGRAYRIRCMVRAEGVGEDEDGASISIEDSFVSSDAVWDTGGEWVELTLEGVTGADQTQLTVMARLGGYGSLNSGRAWFDDFEMTPIDGSAIADLESFATIAPDGAEGGEAVNDSPVAWPFPVAALFYVLLSALILYFFGRGRSPQLEEEKNQSRVLLFSCIAAFLLRAVIALFVRGYGVDMNCFLGWASRMAQTGPARFYSAEAFCDYPPGYLYALWLSGSALRLFSVPYDTGAAWLIIKLLPIAMDVLGALLLYRATKEAFDGAVGLLLSVVFLFNPASLLNSAAWGQIDSVLTLLLSLSMVEAVRGRWYVSLPVFGLSILVKPQALMLAPLGLFMILTEIFSSEEKGKMALRLLLSVLLSLLVMFLAALPFILSLPEALLPASLSFGSLRLSLPAFARPLGFLVNLYAGTLSSYAYVSVNACNLYTLLGLNWVSLDAVSSVRFFAVAMMVFSFLYCFFLYLRAKDRAKIFLCSALLLWLLFALGIKMHERYLYPALLFLLLSYAFDRDLRLLCAFLLLSFTQFVNVGIVLSYEHLTDATRALNAAVSLLNVLGAAFLAWTGWEMCVTGRVFALTRSYRKTAAPREITGERRVNALAEGLFRPREHRLGMKKRDWVLMLSLTLVFAGVSLLNLGSTKAPETAWKSTASGEQITFDLGSVQSFHLSYYGGIANSSFMVQFSDDGVSWSDAHFARYGAGEIFRWLWYAPMEKDENGELYRLNYDGYPLSTARYARLTAERAGLVLHEVAFLDGNGSVLPIASVYSLGGIEGKRSDPKNLIDEQLSCPAYPSYYNGSYFDEIYHARTAYEHLHGLHAYEYTHPPLGKVLIMLGVKIFGMTPFGWRFMGALFGILMIPVMYLLAKQLTRRSALSFFSALLLAADCMHFTQSRIATIDVFAVFFIMLMYLFMIRYAMMSFYQVRLWRTLVPLGLSGLSMGFAIASKWIGIYGAFGLAVIFFLTVWRRYSEYRFARGNARSFDAEQRRVVQRCLKTFPRSLTITLLCCLVFFVAIPLVIYYFSYYWQLAPDGGLTVSRVLNTQVSMFEYHKGISSDAHSFASPWYEWLVIAKPLWYFSGTEFMPAGLVSSISCMGNPVVWWGGLIALFWLIARLALCAKTDRRYLYVVIGYFSQLVPWMFVTRATFIYHYFACVPFLILSTALLFEWIRKKSPRAFRAASIAYAGCAVLLFVAFYPLMSGTPAPLTYVKYLRWFNWYNY